ncbi:LexA regulated protein [Proteus mirabilis]|uniref:LexA regulated protein n=1 Tax=Proteus mirabilis TaxID=584 RepID=A0A379FIA0_PROMI|nr:LexA regulated protein [Proteus mirabilis]
MNADLGDLKQTRFLGMKQLRINKRNQLRRDRVNGLRRVELKLNEDAVNALNELAERKKMSVVVSLLKKYY